MSRFHILMIRILSGSSDKNIDFNDIVYVLKMLGFSVRIKGSHHIFWKEGVTEIINIQPRNGLSKPYQVKQVRSLIVKYKLGETNESEI